MTAIHGSNRMSLDSGIAMVKDLIGGSSNLDFLNSAISAHIVWVLSPSFDHVTLTSDSRHLAIRAISDGQFTCYPDVIGTQLGK